MTIIQSKPAVTFAIAAILIKLVLWKYSIVDFLRVGIAIFHLGFVAFCVLQFYRFPEYRSRRRRRRRKHKSKTPPQTQQKLDQPTKASQKPKTATNSTTAKSNPPPLPPRKAAQATAAATVTVPAPAPAPAPAPVTPLPNLANVPEESDEMMQANRPPPLDMTFADQQPAELSVGGICTPSPSALSPVQDGKEETAEHRIKRERRMMEKRTRVILELLSTERTYVKSLTTLVSKFKKKLGDSPSSYKLQDQDVTDLFSNVESIVDLHQPLLKDLEKNTPHGDIASVFLQYAPFLKMYSVYVSKYDRAIAVMGKHSSNKKFHSFLNKQRSDPDCAGLDLMSYLIMPVQRLPRYELLLAEILKHTQEEDASYARISEALDKVRQIAQQVNERKRQMENSSIILSLQSRIQKIDWDAIESKTETLLLPSRRLMRIGAGSVGTANFEVSAQPIRLRAPRSRFSISFGGKKDESQKAKPREIILFNDMLMWVSLHNQRYKGSLRLAGASLRSPMLASLIEAEASHTPSSSSELDLPSGSRPQSLSLSNSSFLHSPRSPNSPRSPRSPRNIHVDPNGTFESMEPSLTVDAKMPHWFELIVEKNGQQRIVNISFDDAKECQEWIYLCDDAISMSNEVYAAKRSAAEKRRAQLRSHTNHADIYQQLRALQVRNAQRTQDFSVSDMEMDMDSELSPMHSPGTSVDMMAGGIEADAGSPTSKVTSARERTRSGGFRPSSYESDNGLCDNANDNDDDTAHSDAPVFTVNVIDAHGPLARSASGAVMEPPAI
jgi:RhoGEF domain